MLNDFTKNLEKSFSGNEHITFKNSGKLKSQKPKVIIEPYNMDEYTVPCCQKHIKHFQWIIIYIAHFVEDTFMDQVLMNKKEIQKVSIEFRKIASRLLTTTFADGMGNLKRFLYYVNSTPLIKFFIQENNVKQFNIIKDIEQREMFQGYELPLEKSEEISYIYQLLIYTTENFPDLYTLCGHYFK